MKCDNCMIAQETEKSDGPACCAWLLDNVVCGDKSVEDCTEYRRADHREILFRGKRLGNGEWAEGLYVKCDGKINPDRAYILPLVEYVCAEYQTIAIGGFVEVDPATVGQYTGLTDKNGKKIFEGDIVFISEWEEITDVYWRLGAWLLRFRDSDEFLSETAEACEVIGNIHDNPELMGGKGNG